MEKIIKEAMPHVEDSLEKEVLAQSLLMLHNKSENGKAKPQYHDSVLKYSLSLLGKVNKQTYDSLAEILFLATHRQARRLKKKLVDSEGVAEDGPRKLRWLKLR
jgi:hypothetical protein